MKFVRLRKCHVLAETGDHSFVDHVVGHLFELVAIRVSALVLGGVRQALVDDEISIGDYVLTNGVVAAAVVVDAVVRLLPGVLGGDGATIEESFAEGALEYPQYTRPAEYRGMAVPDVLLSGDHGAIARWREEESRKRTETRRPDLLD